LDPRGDQSHGEVLFDLLDQIGLKGFELGSARVNFGSDQFQMAFDLVLDGRLFDKLANHTQMAC
jgi:hypothetical protein